MTHLRLSLFGANSLILRNFFLLIVLGSLLCVFPFRNVWADWEVFQFTGCTNLTTPVNKKALCEGTATCKWVSEGGSIAPVAENISLYVYADSICSNSLVRNTARVGAFVQVGLPRGLHGEAMSTVVANNLPMYFIFNMQPCDPLLEYIEVEIPIPLACSLAGTTASVQTANCIPPTNGVCAQGFVENGAGQCCAPLQEDCTSSGGSWNFTTNTCGPNPASTPASTVGGGERTSVHPTQAVCEAAGWVWNPVASICMPNTHADCSRFGWNWNFTTSTCSQVPEPPPPPPNNQVECEAASWFWNPFSDSCQQDPPPTCNLFPEVCENGIWSFEWCGCVPYNTPIVLDLTGDGFDLTTTAGGVYFNLNNIRGKERVAWTSPSDDDAWLVLDRNGNGTIDDGTELFGDVTPQSDPPVGDKKNGFLALAEYDKRPNGGNANGQIDSGDSVFSKLRLWRDTNHNGLSEANELKSLSSQSVAAIDLDYRYSKKIDNHGNQFSFRAKVNNAQGQQMGRWAWDVYLVRSP
jgi:hypothetical protein